MKYHGLSGKIYDVEEKKLASGGEGSIHNICQSSTQVAKIFKKERRSSMREEKLCHMVQTRLNAEQLEDVTWPQDVIYDQTGFCGYIMPKVNKVKSITAIYSSSGKNYDLRYRIRAAINLCQAVQTVHKMGQVCGDLNPQNICINLDSQDRKNILHITLVDTDSYHFTSEGKIYRCEVGLADYIAPELQKKMTGGSTLRSAPLPTYTKETDLFALAVHIFTLLMNGCHPFACAKEVNNTYENTMAQMDDSFRKDSVVAPQPIENIKNGFFPFYEKRTGITYPMYAPSLDSLPVNIRKLFVQTFVEGFDNPKRRVDTKKWIEVLMQYLGEIVSCQNNKEHYYFSQNSSCPLCEINNRIHNVFYNQFGGGSIPISEEFEEEEAVESIDLEQFKKMEGKKKTVGRVGLFWNIAWIIVIVVYILMHL